MKSRAKTGGMGTFGGVFTPSILTILGLVLFLRLGFVVGTVGLGQTLLIILIASVVSVLTSISLAAISTNLEVRGGGVYYIISRTLGLPFGGAIGLVLFVALSVSVGFYCVGFAEGLTSTLGIKSARTSQLLAGAAVLVVTLVVWFGAAWATRIQYAIMALLGVALVSFALGAGLTWSSATVIENFGPVSEWRGFWVAFAIFFPAVTGFTQGVNMSGDLADPVRSIPRGTAFAVGLSTIIYLLVAIALAGALPRGTLLLDYGAMRNVSAFAPLIDAGIFAATLSSALASLMGAPRILQSLAKDNIFRPLHVFAVGHGPDQNPRAGILLSAIIGLGTVALGNLNVIASVVAMFFVVTYGLLNYATYFEARARSPSFRPALKWYDPRISLLGGLVSLGVMLAINFTAGFIAIGILFAIYQYLRQSQLEATWADGQRSHHLQIVRENLLAANARAEHPRDWRPQILAFSDNKERRGRLVKFANWIEGHSGLTTVIRILEGRGRRARRELAAAENELRDDLAKLQSNAFPLVISADNLDAAVPVAVQSAGIGPTRINTVLVNWLNPNSPNVEDERHARFLSNLHASFLLGFNLVVLDAHEEDWHRLAAIRPAQRVIDVWWLDNASGRLLLVLAYLLTRNDEWSGARIRVLSHLDEGDPIERRGEIEAELKAVRIDASVVVLPNSPDRFAEVVEMSGQSAIVFKGIRIKDRRFTDWYGLPLDDLLPTLPIVVLAMAAEDVDLAPDPDVADGSPESDRPPLL